MENGNDIWEIKYPRRPTISSVVQLSLSVLKNYFQGLFVLVSFYFLSSLSRALALVLSLSTCCQFINFSQAIEAEVFLQNPARLASAWTTNRGSRRIDSRAGRVQHNGSPFAIGESWRGNVTDGWAANFLIGRLFIVELGNSNLSMYFLVSRAPSIGAYRVPCAAFDTVKSILQRSWTITTDPPMRTWIIHAFFKFATKNLHLLSKLSCVILRIVR